MLPIVIRLALSSLIVAGPFAVEALADPIDFRHPAFSGADGASFFEVTIDGLLLRFDPLPSGATLYWDSTDGFGVRHAYEVDEIEQDEILGITFKSGPVDLATVFLTDLFYEGNPRYFEIGSYQLNGGSWIPFAQTDPTTLPSPTSNGEFDLALNAPDISSIRFRAPGILVNGGQTQNHEYSVAGIDISTVPEPSTILLVGLGLAGAAVTGRWRRRGPRTPSGRRRSS